MLHNKENMVIVLGFDTAVIPVVGLYFRLPRLNKGLLSNLYSAAVLPCLLGTLYLRNGVRRFEP